MAATHITALADPAMLDKIDKLFACGVGELVDLPQIVVVGDQSSGKSSVLEGLICKPLPRDVGLCTRFATHIIFRRTKIARIEVSIIPHKDADAEHASRVRKWGRKVEELDSDSFVKIMKEVHVEMGLAGDHDDGVKRPTFSNDVLSLEISGPDQEHLSVIDVPGIFKATTEGVTTKEDIALVRNMVKSYMDNPRSVILAVIPANVDVATQEILELATEADTHGDRTMGVLTKPDLVDRGAENCVVDLVEGRARVMKLGWHMIRNPGQKEMSDKSSNRDKQEKEFFRSQEPWNELEKDKVGVDTLRLRLKEVISSVVKREFPKVKAEIKNRLDARLKQLADLGPERTSTTAQRDFLTKMASEFQRLVILGQTANYGVDDNFQTHSDLRIASAVKSRMKSFSDSMDRYGHEYEFMPEDNGPPSKYRALGSHASQGAPHTPVHVGFALQKGAPATPATFATRSQTNVEELTEIFQPSESLPLHPVPEIRYWLNCLFQNNSGWELGTFNPTVLTTAIKEQCQKWPKISKGFVEDVILLVHRFILAALEVVCPDNTIRRAITDTLLDALTKGYLKALENAEFVMKVETSGAPNTLNHYFNDNLQKSRQGTIMAGMKRKACEGDRPDNGWLHLNDIAGQVQNMSNDEHLVRDIHDILKSYYKVSRKGFLDNICKQSVGHFLLHCEDSPLALFSPVWVSGLTNAELEEIAGEVPSVKRMRVQLSKEVDSLKEAMKILARA